MTFTHFKNRLLKNTSGNPENGISAFISIDKKVFKGLLYRGTTGQLVAYSNGQILFVSNVILNSGMVNFHGYFEVGPKNFKHIHCPALGLNRV